MKNNVETTELKTYFDNYEHGTKGNEQRWDFWHSDEKSRIRFSITPAGFTN